MDSLLTLGNRKFEQLLMIKSNGHGVTEKENEHYIERRRRRNLEEFQEILRQTSHSHLIEKIQKYENDQHQLLDLIGTYENKLQHMNKVKYRVKILEILLKNKTIKVSNHEKALLGKTFDEAFMPE